MTSSGDRDICAKSGALDAYEADSPVSLIAGAWYTVDAHLTRRDVVESAPDSPQLPGRAKARTFSHRFDVEPRTREHLSRQRDSHAIDIVDDAHDGVITKQS